MAGKIRADRWRDWVMLALAAWLFVSPWLLGFAGALPTGGEAVSVGTTVAAWNAWIVAILIVALAVWAIAMFAEWHDWANGVLGVWLLVAPWLLGFGAVTSAVWNHLLVGALIVILAAWELWDVRHQEHRATA